VSNQSKENSIINNAKVVLNRPVKQSSDEPVITTADSKSNAGTAKFSFDHARQFIMTKSKKSFIHV
jgi:hypothetical protein